MGKKSLITAITIGTLALSGIAGASLINNREFAAPNAEYKNFLSTSKALNIVDGATKINTNKGTALDFKLTAATENENAVVDLAKGGTIENVSPIQNIQKVWVNGKVGEEALVNKTGALTVDYGFITGETTTWVHNNLTLGKDNGLSHKLNGENPSFIRLHAKEAVTLTDLSIDSGCVDGGEHAKMPDKYVKRDVRLVGKFEGGSWNPKEGIEVAQNEEYIAEYYIKHEFKKGDIFKFAEVNAEGNATYSNVGSFETDKGAFEAKYLTMKAENGDIIVNRDCVLSIYWKGLSTKAFIKLEDDTTPTVNVYFTNVPEGWAQGDIHVHAWIEGSFGTPWPGKKLENPTDGVYMLALQEDLNNLIIHDNSANNETNRKEIKNVDLKALGDKNCLDIANATWISVPAK